MTGKYMAYVGSYSYTGKAKGITVYDVDVEKGKFIYRCEVEVDNSSYLTVSRDKKMLYSIADGSVAERNFRPHVSCSRMTPDEKFLMVADLGIDQVKVYRFDRGEGRIAQVDTIRSELESAPRHFVFSSDGKFFYLLHELKNVIDVYSYQTGDRTPQVEKVQTIATTGDDPNQLTAACAIRLSPDENYLFCSNAGDNSVSMYERDTETGMLTLKFCLPISGEYPKDIAIFPDGQHLAAINHGGNISFFHIDYEKGLLVMSDRSVAVNEPNCCEIVKIG